MIVRRDDFRPDDWHNEHRIAVLRAEGKKGPAVSCLVLWFSE
jgi:hypothetical protein